MATDVEMEIVAVLRLTHIMKLSAMCMIRTIPGKRNVINHETDFQPSILPFSVLYYRTPMYPPTIPQKE